MSNALEMNESNFQAEVMESEVPVLVDFWASWCMPCKMMGPVVDDIAAEFAGRVKVVKVDVDSNKAISSQFNVRGIPTLLFVNKGEATERMVGVQPKMTIAAKLNEILGA